MALHLPELHRFATQVVVQLCGKDGGRSTLILGALIACRKETTVIKLPYFPSSSPTLAASELKDRVSISHWRLAANAPSEKAAALEFMLRPHRTSESGLEALNHRNHICGRGTLHPVITVRRHTTWIKLFHNVT